MFKDASAGAYLIRHGTLLQGQKGAVQLLSLHEDLMPQIKALNF